MTAPSRFSTINGFAIHHVRKIAEKHFGDYLDKVEPNEKYFEIHVCDKVDKKEVDDFIDRNTEVFKFQILLVTTCPYPKPTKTSK